MYFRAPNLEDDVAEMSAFPELVELSEALMKDIWPVFHYQAGVHLALSHHLA